MADLMATIANIGIVKCVGALLIVGLLVAAFAIGGKGGNGGNSKGGSNNQNTGGGNT